MKLSNKQLSFLTVASALGIGLLFSLVDPQQKPIIYVFLPVLLIWVFLFCSLLLVIRKLLKIHTALGEVVVFVVSGFIIVLLLLSGIGQLTTGDVVITGFLALVSTFYFYRSWA